MSTHNIGFYEDLTKNIFELSSNSQLISSAGCFVFLSKLRPCDRRSVDTGRNVTTYMCQIVHILNIYLLADFTSVIIKV